MSCKIIEIIAFAFVFSSRLIDLKKKRLCNCSLFYFEHENKGVSAVTAYIQ